LSSNKIHHPPSLKNITLQAIVVHVLAIFIFGIYYDMEVFLVKVKENDGVDSSQYKRTEMATNMCMFMVVFFLQSYLLFTLLSQLGGVVSFHLQLVLHCLDPSLLCIFSGL